MKKTDVFYERETEIQLSQKQYIANHNLKTILNNV